MFFVLVLLRTCAYQGVRNVFFREVLRKEINEWSTKCSEIYHPTDKVVSF